MKEANVIIGRVVDQYGEFYIHSAFENEEEIFNLPPESENVHFYWKFLFQPKSLFMEIKDYKHQEV